MIQRLKVFYRNNCKVLNFFPMLNRVKIKGKNNLLILDSPIINSKIYINGNNNRVLFKKSFEGGSRGVYINIDGDNNHIVINENVSMINVSLYMEDSNNEILIGKETKICGSTEFAAIEGTSITVGEECLLSSDIKFRTGDSHSILNLNGDRINPSANISIGNRVWIGNDSKILKGVRICDDSIIGTGAVVTKAFAEKNVVVGGNPAMIIKRGVKWETIRR